MKLHGIAQDIFLKNNDIGGHKTYYGKWFIRDKQKWVIGVFVDIKDSDDDCWIAYGYDVSSIDHHKCTKELLGSKLTRNKKKQYFEIAKRYALEAEEYFYYIKDLEKSYYAEVTDGKIDQQKLLVEKNKPSKLDEEKNFLKKEKKLEEEKLKILKKRKLEKEKQKLAQKLKKK